MTGYIINALFVAGALSAFAVFVFGIARIAVWIVSDTCTLDTLNGVAFFGGFGWFVVFMFLLETGLSVPYKTGLPFGGAPFCIYFLATYLLASIIVARTVKQYKQEKHAFG